MSAIWMGAHHILILISPSPIGCSSSRGKPLPVRLCHTLSPEGIQGWVQRNPCKGCHSLLSRCRTRMRLGTRSPIRLCDETRGEKQRKNQCDLKWVSSSIRILSRAGGHRFNVRDTSVWPAFSLQYLTTRKQTKSPTRDKCMNDKKLRN